MAMTPFTRTGSRAMSTQQPPQAADQATKYTAIPLPWIREDGTVCDCYPLTVPPTAGRDCGRRVFVYAERGRLSGDVVKAWLARIYKLWSDPSWDPPWGTV